MTTLMLLLGLVTDDDYRRILDAQRRGLRYQVARRGWSNRYRAVVRTFAYLLAIAVFAYLVIFAMSVVL